MDRQQALRDIAKAYKLMPDWFRSTTIFTILFDDDLSKLEAYTALFGGRIWPSKDEYPIHAARGRWVWRTYGEQCYNFCKEIQPYLLEAGDGRRWNWCENCIMRYESENRRHKQAR